MQNITERENLFKAAERDLRFDAQFYRLGDQFTDLPADLAEVNVIDVTKIPGCHYAVRNVFVPIIHHLELKGVRVGEERFQVNPDTSILVEPSTGNGWTAFSDAASYLGYEHVVVMPDGLPEARYKHPLGRKVEIIKTPTEDYALGMPRQMANMVVYDNIDRAKRGEKIYVSPNHAVSASDIAVEAMSEIGRQLLANLDGSDDPLRVVISMGNGASLCSIGEYVKKHREDTRVVATESFNFGGGYDRFAKIKDLPGYQELFGIEPGNSDLMAKFSTYGTNAPIGIELPLQTRAINGELIDKYALFTDSPVLRAYEKLQPGERCLNNAYKLPKYDRLPRVLYERYGNSTLANIAVASKFTVNGEQVVAMAYDGRENY